MLQEPGEELLAFYRAAIRRSSQRKLIFKSQGLVALGLVRPKVVVEANVFLSDVIEVPEAEAEKMIKRFELTFSDPGLRESVRVGCPHGRLDDLHASGFEDSIKASSEFGVTVVEDEPLLHPVPSNHKLTLRAC